MPRDLTSVTLELSPLFRASRLLSSNGMIGMLAGGGSDREFVEVDAEGLLEWILARVQPATRSELVADIGARFGLDDVGAKDLLSDFIESEILVPSARARVLCEKGHRWEEWGWRDAFDFHNASYGLRFDKLYGTDRYEEVVAELFADVSHTGPQPPPYKEVASETSVELDPLTPSRDRLTKRASLGEALLANMPINHYTARGIDVGELAAVLRFACGVQRTFESAFGPQLLKPSPSGGARHPIEVYVAPRHVDGLAEGIYHYHPGKHSLICVNDASALARLDDVGFDKTGIKTSSVVLFVTARWLRHSWKYRYSRSYRMVLIDAGHVCQTVRLVGAALGVDVYYSPAVDDSVACEILGISDPYMEDPLYLLGLGRDGVV